MAEMTMNLSGLADPPKNPRMVELIFNYPWDGGNKHVFHARYFEGRWWRLKEIYHPFHTLTWTTLEEDQDQAYVIGWRDSVE